MPQHVDVPHTIISTTLNIIIIPGPAHQASCTESNGSLVNILLFRWHGFCGDQLCQQLVQRQWKSGGLQTWKKSQICQSWTTSQAHSGVCVRMSSCTGSILYNQVLKLVFLDLFLRFWSHSVLEIRKNAPCSWVLNNFFRNWSLIFIYVQNV